MEKKWNLLFKEAKERLKSREISTFITYGNSSCVLLSDSGNIYCGTSIDSNTNIGSCSEKNAVISMFNNLETKIAKMVILNELEEIIMPCSNCLAYLLELDDDNQEMEILVSLNPLKTIKLKDLLPDWWGTLRVKK